MRIPFSWFGLALALGLSAPGLAAAADIAVFAPEISNLSPPDAASVGGLIAQSYAAVSQRDVIAPDRSSPALVQTGNYAAAAAQLGVAEYIRLSAVAAGRRLVITAGRYQADGRSITQLRQTAESIEDMALAADSIARALFTGVVPSVAPAAIVAPMPALPLRPSKKRNEIIYGLKTGVHMPMAKGASYYPAISLQFDGRLQLPHWFLEFGAGFLIPTTISDNDDDYVPCAYDPASGTSACPERMKSKRGHVGGITAEIGASYYLTDTNVAPYVGGGIIPRVILAGLDNSDLRDVASMSVYAQFGLTFPRETSTRFFVDLRIAQALLEQHLENGREVWPTEPSLHVGIGW